MLVAYKNSNEQLLHTLFEKRHKKKLELRERQSGFFVDLIELTSQHRNIDLGAIINGETHCPLPKNVLHSLLMSSSSRLLRNSKFFFELVNLSAEKQVEKADQERTLANLLLEPNRLLSIPEPSTFS